VSKKVVDTPLSLALRGVRRHLDFQQEDLASRLVVSRRSVVRWERGECEPLPSQRAGIVERLADLPLPVLAPLAKSLHVTLVPPKLGSDEAKRALDAHLHAVAESADVSARRVREAVVAVLDKARELGLTVEGARGLLAAGGPAAKG
jgi:transcriptional regulator with XRE-family HTH domain